MVVVQTLQLAKGQQQIAQWKWELKTTAAISE